MINVVIADDEKKVCRLIHNLCNWSQLEMEVVGFAYNGIQAIELIQNNRVDILITDIRMPGCDGIELIQKVRESNSSIEILIISGFEDFTYAQSAIRMGVRDYLLKPVKKQELESILSKMADNILQQEVHMDTTRKLLSYIEDDKKRTRRSVFEYLLNPQEKQEYLSIDTLNSVYQLNMQPGCFQIFILHFDYTVKCFKNHSSSEEYEGYCKNIQSVLLADCNEIEFFIKKDDCYFLINYPESNNPVIRNHLRQCMNRLEMKKFQLLGTVASIGIGKAYSDCEQLCEGVASAQSALDERLVKGCWKLLEAPAANGDQNYSELIKLYENQFLKAIELYDETMASTAMEKLYERLKQEETLTGTCLLNIVNSIGMHVISSGIKNNASEVGNDYLHRSSQCSSLDELMKLLSETLSFIIKNLQMKLNEENTRPIRIAKQYLNNHYSEQVTLKDVAQLVGFSSTYFSSFFKQECGIGFSDYLTQLRIEKAKELLKDTDINVKEICRMVGYSDLKHFTLVFRKQTGLKMGEYRKIYG